MVSAATRNERRPKVAVVIELNGVVDSVIGGSQVEQCKGSRIATSDSIKQVIEDLSSGGFSRMTGPEARLVRREKLMENTIGNKLVGNKTFQKLRYDRKVEYWAIGGRIIRQQTKFFF
jgi:hypothetical protein